MNAATGARDYHEIMRGRLSELCRKCTFKQQSSTRLCAKAKTDCIFYNVLITECVLEEYHPSALKDIPIETFSRALRKLGYTGSLEKTRTVTI